MALGERFRVAREQRGLTLSEVGEQLRIRSVYLAAIEEENWKAIGASVYIRGFLRTYARFLGLDPEEAVAEFNAATNPAPVAADTAISSAPRQRSLAPFIWIAAVVATGLIGFVIYLYVTPPKAAVTAAQQSTAPVSPSASPVQTARPQPLLTRTLALHVTSASWLRVTIDGNVSMEGTFRPGTSRTFHGKSAVVRAGNAAGVELTVDGKPVGKLGGVGDVVEKSFLL
ncbi:MAG TPA: RodZ domain-containing protein [Candidatus Rubrimentiphilum sp.]|nr:RodZ domain-containing protein [Candidatus Rubrimentiphilum sp.]